MFDTMAGQTASIISPSVLCIIQFSGFWTHTPRRHMTIPSRFFMYDMGLVSRGKCYLPYVTSYHFDPSYTIIHENECHP